MDEEDLYQIISNEHAKQIHLKETLKIEAQQLKTAKEKEEHDQESVQKQAILDRKTKMDLELSQDENHRKAVVEELSQSLAAGGDGEVAHSVAKTLNEFLSEYLYLVILCLFCINYAEPYFFIDPLNAIKRGVKKNHDTLEVSFFDIKEILAILSFLKKDYLEFKEEVRNVLSMVTSKGPDASEFFPAKDNATLERFMVKDDMFEKRREALYFLLYNCSCDNQKAFSESFIYAVFTKEYIETHIWPLGR